MLTALLAFLLSLFLETEPDADDETGVLNDPGVLRSKLHDAHRKIETLEAAIAGDTDKLESMKDTRRRELSGEARKWRLKFRQAEARIAELEAGGPADEPDDDDDEPTPDPADLKMENLFMRAVIARGGSLNTEDAWLLLTSKGFLDAVDPSDSATMDDALDKLVDRYPWLADDSDDAPDDPPPPPPSGGRARKLRDSSKVTDKANLKQRFPALKSRH